jgi:hypothetical protein
MYIAYWKLKKLLLRPWASVLLDVVSALLVVSVVVIQIRVSLMQEVTRETVLFGVILLSISALMITNMLVLRRRSSRRSAWHEGGASYLRPAQAESGESRSDVRFVPQRPRSSEIDNLHVAFLKLRNLRSAMEKYRTRESSEILGQAFVEQMLSHVAGVVPFSAGTRASLMLVSEARSETLAVCASFPTGIVADMDFALPLHREKERVTADDGVGAAGFAFRGAHPVYVPETRSGIAFWAAIRMGGGISYEQIGRIWVPSPRNGIRSALAIPLMSVGGGGQSVLGVLALDSNRRDAFSEADILTAIFLSDVLADGLSSISGTVKEYGEPSARDDGLGGTEVRQKEPGQDSKERRA